MLSTRVAVARLDNAGDVLLSGPAVRAVASSATVSYLCGPAGRSAAELLPGVDRVETVQAAWIADPAPKLDRRSALQLVGQLADLDVDELIILTSFHQSALPLALLARMAGITRIGAVSTDYPGSLLDVRHRVDDDIHEVERSLSTVAAMGYLPPAGDDGRLAVDVADPMWSDPALGLPGTAGWVVVHAGASVPARAPDPHRLAATVAALVARGDDVVVTGGPAESARTALLTAGLDVGGQDGGGQEVGGRGGAGRVVDVTGRTDLAGLARVLAAASVVVTGNTGPAHLAAAVGTPVVDIYAPTVPAVRWRPWGVPHRVLGHQTIPCAGCRARVCPVAGHPCVSGVGPTEILAAIDELRSGTRPGRWPVVDNPSAVPA